MHVRGVAYLAREGLMQEEFGAERWAQFTQTLAPRLTFLAAKVLPVSRIPVGEFLALNDAIVRTFYRGDDAIYWRFGEQSGEYALTHQLKGLFAKDEVRKFLQFTPQIWKSYFDGGELTCEVAPQHVDIRIFGVPVKHVYFEYSVIGFARGGLALLGVSKPTPSRLKGFSAGDNEVLYRFAAPA